MCWLGITGHNFRCKQFTARNLLFFCLHHVTFNLVEPQLFICDFGWRVCINGIGCGSTSVRKPTAYRSTGRSAALSCVIETTLERSRRNFPPRHAPHRVRASLHALPLHQHDALTTFLDRSRAVLLASLASPASLPRETRLGGLRCHFVRHLRWSSCTSCRTSFIASASARSSSCAIAASIPQYCTPSFVSLPPVSGVSSRRCRCLQQILHQQGRAD